MRKLVCALALGAGALGTTPLAAQPGWSEFETIRRAYDRPYVFFMPGDYGRSGRFVSWDDGYFARGLGVHVDRNQALFDYDREYPYDYRSYTMIADEEMQPRRETACTSERVRDGAGGWTDVRICRN